MRALHKTLILILANAVCRPAWSLEPGVFIPPKPDYQLPAIPTPSIAPTDGLLLENKGQATQFVKTRARFRLKKIQFEGNKSLSDAQLQVAVQAFINKVVSRVDLENIRLQLLQLYSKAGYLYPSVVLPSQHIKGGLVRYRINEGQLTQINIKGAERLDQAYIRERIHLPAEQPLKRDALLEQFQLLLTDPLIERLNGSLRSGDQAGEAVLDLEVKRAQAYELYLGMDNYTPPSVGSYTGYLRGTVRNLTGQGDFLHLDLNGSEGMQALNSFFSIPVNHYGTRFNLGLQLSQAKVVDRSLEHLDIKNKFFDINIGVNQTLLQQLNRTLNFELQYALRQTKSSVLGLAMPLSAGAEPDGKARVSVIRFIQNYLDRDAGRVLSLRSSFNVGFDAFNATTHASPQPDGRFFSWQGQLRYLYRLDERGTELFLRTDLQFASESLLPLERFALGGIYTVRGYREYELVRDQGYALALELRYPLWQSTSRDGHQLQIIPFFDFGQAWNKHQAAQTLYSAGLGFKWQWQRFNAEFYWAEAFSPPTALTQEYDLQDSGIHFQLQVQLF